MYNNDVDKLCCDVINKIKTHFPIYTLLKNKVCTLLAPRNIYRK